MSIFLIKGLQLLLSLSIIVLLHELGHFIPAKIFKTRVEKFYLFFDVKFSLFKKKIGDTVYGIGWLPLGGYVKISGMIDESMDTEQLKKEPQPWEFRSKPSWQRLIIMLGGVTVNLILGFLIYTMILFVWGKNTLDQKNLPSGLYYSDLAKTIGFEAGDEIISVDGKMPDNILDVSKYLFLRGVSVISVKRTDGTLVNLNIPEDIGKKMMNSGDLRPIGVNIPAIIDSVIPNSIASKVKLRKGDEIIGTTQNQFQGLYDFRKFMSEPITSTFSLVIKRNEIIDTLNISLAENSKLGVYNVIDFDIKFKNEKLGIFESISQGFYKGYWTLYDYVVQFKYVFTKKGASQLGGFGAIGSLFPATWDWQGFWSSTALISIILAFMNLLPIPALDGGHVMFLIYEIISGKKPNDKFMEYAQMFGFFLLLSLVIYANGNDIYRALFN
ncbi:MAG: RIP metalloprotease RseP [Flavobacteriaceae bacterium]|nr:RIP metalloprotease RseP [Flavobacteriaceae bacterium]|tara:strand:- start:15923 stop:17245 length:1323 start_codon:yes stop_codon:yes gene_type:complete